MTTLCLSLQWQNNKWQKISSHTKMLLRRDIQPQWPQIYGFTINCNLSPFFVGGVSHWLESLGTGRRGFDSPHHH